MHQQKNLTSEHRIINQDMDDLCIFMYRGLTRGKVLSGIHNL